MRGLSTSEATLGRAQELAARLGKEAIVVRDSPGFATSRLGVILGCEAIRMLEAGVEEEKISNVIYSQILGRQLDYDRLVKGVKCWLDDLTRELYALAAHLSGVAPRPDISAGIEITSRCSIRRRHVCQDLLLAERPAT